MYLAIMALKVRGQRPRFVLDAMLPWLQNKPLGKQKTLGASKKSGDSSKRRNWNDTWLTVRG